MYRVPILGRAARFTARQRAKHCFSHLLCAFQEGYYWATFIYESTKRLWVTFYFESTRNYFYCHVFATISPYPTISTISDSPYPPRAACPKPRRHTPQTHSRRQQHGNGHTGRLLACDILHRWRTRLHIAYCRSGKVGGYRPKRCLSSSLISLACSSIS